MQLVQNIKQHSNTYEDISHIDKFLNNPKHILNIDIKHNDIIKILEDEIKKYE